MARSPNRRGILLLLGLGAVPILAASPVPIGDAESACPSGTSLNSYLEAQSLLPRSRTQSTRSAAATPPVVSVQDGVLVIEDAGLVLRNDRVFDLPMESLEFVPSGTGYVVSMIPSAYVPVTGQAVWLGEPGWRAQQIALSAFPFPFGGIDRTTFWMTTTNMISFEPPGQPVKIGLCTEGCFDAEGNVLHDRLPRISPLQHGTFMYGRNAYIQGDSTQAVITWQWDNPANMDVQVVLFPDGRIHLNYNAVLGIEHGVPVVVTGNDAFWNDLRLGGDVVDPAGDITIPSPDGPAMDFLGATARQVGTSELLQVEIELAGPPPAVAENDPIIYRVVLRDQAGDPEPLGTYQLQWQAGWFYYVTEPVKLIGNTLRLNLRLWDLPLTGNDLHLEMTTIRGGGPYEDGDSMELTATFAPLDGRMMLDYSADLPVTVGDRPIYEAFTLPALQPGEVLSAVSPLFEDVPAIESFAIFQNLQTDLFFFGGGYHASGNNGVDGIGYGTSAEPRRPGLMHLNNLYIYGNEEPAMQVLNHEFGHRWLYDFSIEEFGLPSRSLNPADGHPAGWVHTPAARPVYKGDDYSVMGGSTWVDNGDGTFSSPPENKGWGNGFSWHELYVMGLASAVETPDWWYIDNSVPPLPNRYWAPNDTLVSGDRVPVTVDQIIAVEGPRFPVYPDSIQDFMTPTVLVARPGGLLQSELDIVNNLCATWETRFNTATDLRATIRCRFNPPDVSIISPPSDLTISAGETVDFVGAATDADGDAVELRWSFPGVAPDVIGDGPHPVLFFATGVYDFRVTAVDQTGMLGSSEDTIRITVECPTTPPTETVEELRLNSEGGDIRFTWTDLVPPPTGYVVLSSGTPDGSFLPVGSAASGTAGLLAPTPAGLVFYEVAASENPGCLGPY